MHKKPIFIPIMTAFFLVLALLFPVQIMVLFRYSPLDIISVLTKLTPLNYIVMTLLIGTSYLTYKMNSKVFILLPLLNFCIFFNNYIVAEYGQIYSHTQTYFASFGMLALSLGFYQKDIFKIYHEIKYRYWLTSKRFKKNMPVLICIDDIAINTECFDISKTGMFIKTDPNLEIFNLKTNSTIDVYINIGKSKVKLSAKVIRKCLQKGNYPKGVGVAFNIISDHNAWDGHLKRVEMAA